MNKLSIAALVCVAAIVLGSWPAAADTLQVRFTQTRSGVSPRDVRVGLTCPSLPLRPLWRADGDEAAIGLERVAQRHPPMSADVTGDTIKLDLSPEVLEGLDEARLTEIFDQFKATLGDFPGL